MNFDIFDKALDKIYARLNSNGGKPFEITFTPKMLAYGDTWLLQVARCGKSETLTFTNSCILFEGDDPVRYDEIPESFCHTIVKNL